MEKYYTYILQSESTGRYYIGHTKDITTRLHQHNHHDAIGSSSTRRLKGPWKIVYLEDFDTRSDAMKREREFKSWKSSRSIAEFIRVNSLLLKES